MAMMLNVTIDEIKRWPLHRRHDKILATDGELWHIVVIKRSVWHDHDLQPHVDVKFYHTDHHGCVTVQATGLEKFYILPHQDA